MQLPAKFRINAWTGEEAAFGGVADGASDWAIGSLPGSQRWMRGVEAPAHLTDWMRPSVGWGLVLPDSTLSMPDAEKANAADAPEAIRELRVARGNAPVLRYRTDLGTSRLRRYYADSPAHDLAVGVGLSDVGTDRGQIPRYLLIYGNPEVIPWNLQYELNRSYFVGRLTLEGTALTNYVSALMNGFEDAQADENRVAIWSTDHGGGDITTEMREKIASPTIEAVTANPNLTHSIHTGSAATAENLEAALEDKPAMVLTTSHGQTGPLDDLEMMRTGLGIPIDQEHRPIATSSTLRAVSAPGAMWYCHACCSAGADTDTSYASLLDAASSAGRVVHAVAQLGATVSPLAEALLGNDHPSRGFVGQVEPTFDWTLSDSETGQPLTMSIKCALYDHYLAGDPIGFAFDDYYRAVGSLYTQYARQRNRINDGVPGARLAALRLRLTAIDRQSMVLLGDPTAALG